MSFHLSRSTKMWKAETHVRILKCFFELFTLKFSFKMLIVGILSSFFSLKYDSISYLKCHISPRQRYYAKKINEIIPLALQAYLYKIIFFVVLNLSITRTIDHRVCCYVLIKPPYLIHLSYKDKTQKQHNNQNRPRTIVMWNEILLNRTFLGRI